MYNTMILQWGCNNDRVCVQFIHPLQLYIEKEVQMEFTHSYKITLINKSTKNTTGHCEMLQE
jgi:hypothetical protein